MLGQGRRRWSNIKPTLDRKEVTGYFSNKQKRGALFRRVSAPDRFINIHTVTQGTCMSRYTKHDAPWRNAVLLLGQRRRLRYTSKPALFRGPIIAMSGGFYTNAHHLNLINTSIYTAVQSQKAAPGYISSEHLLPFGLALQNSACNSLSNVSQHKTLIQCWKISGQTSATLSQHYPSTGLTYSFFQDLRGWGGGGGSMIIDSLIRALSGLYSFCRQPCNEDVEPRSV